MRMILLSQLSTPTFVQNFINKLNSVFGLSQPWVYLLVLEVKQTSFDSIFYLLSQAKYIYMESTPQGLNGFCHRHLNVSA
jgi:hypothetical protein